MWCNGQHENNFCSDCLVHLRTKLHMLLITETLLNISSHTNRKACYKSVQYFREGERVKSDGTCRFRWALICPNRFSALSSLPCVCVCVSVCVSVCVCLEWLRTPAWPQKFKSGRKDRRGALNANNEFALFKKPSLSLRLTPTSHPFVVLTTLPLCAPTVFVRGGKQVGQNNISAISMQTMEV